MGERNYVKIKINGENLKRLLLKRGYTLERASAEIGKSRSYLGNCVFGGEMMYATALALETVFGIKRDEYEIKEQAEEPAEAPAVDYALIKQIVMDCLREYWGE